MDTILEKQPVEKEEDAVDFLSRKSGLSKSKIKDAMTKGAVWLDAGKRTTRLRRAKSRLQVGNEVSLFYSEKIINTIPQVPNLIDDQIQFSVWSKPSGLMSAGSRFGDHCSINRVVEKMLDRPTFLVHRLDRFVWGLMVLAHTKQCAADISKQFQNRQTLKLYKAITHGRIATPMTIDQPIDGKEALSWVRPLIQLEDRTLIEVQIETGRKHQIRRHLASIGHPIIGDHQHGHAEPGGIQLASVCLEFTSPQGEKLRYELSEKEQPTLSL